MITATSRTCGGCHRLLPEPPAPQVCPDCGRVAVPLHADWPPKLKRWLLGMFVRSFFAPFATKTEQQRWERLLLAVMAGKQWGTRILSYASPPEDCYIEAVKQLAAWERDGAPQLY